MEDTYMSAKVLELKYEGSTVRVHIPDITEDERIRRMEKIQAAAERMLKA